MKRSDAKRLRPTKFKTPKADPPKEPPKIEAETAPSQPPPQTTEPTPPADRDQLRQVYVDFLKTLSKDEQISELRKIVFDTPHPLGWTWDEFIKFQRSSTITIGPKRRR
jgi:hypothetical protein